MWSLQNSPSPPFPPSQVINDDWSLTHTLEPSNTFLLLRSRSWFTLWLSRKSKTPRCLSLTARQIGTSSAWRKIDTKMLDIDASNYRHRSAVHHKCKSTVVVSKTVSNKFQRKRVVNTRLEKSKPLYKSKWPMGPALNSGFISMKRLGVLLLPPGWDASPSQGYPQHICWCPFVHLGKEKHCESKVSCLRSQHNDPGQGSSPDHSIRGRAH